ncbi:MurR/RpiR family transcriptional regulator [Marinilactibacillus psychrotolerans]|uniref:RpiR family transcriptional regulator n=2 Tax=Marinilactibacillus psychrotolerans TaxID=191770 RepID=A0A511H360_9LACT|nr:MurR/RpiR family transcriptional regulator [Marinilactibacillus psychrotolerans]TLQ05293.1 MurR/RpiR family transcriptional regulator [Marinilactibacillus psychrotolerans]SDD28843.1 transcriptional regulator, RpiR family [Marinilactibacillus psychrotolerans]SJN32890.1 Transcriptional regulator, RpiR family [Marinilactibacillus psychrotolerans 42ea]GEL67962.1 transcriptional regulator [Marinilactibacillus psychrotolerans]GEQ33301.1 RpiR family transcriptional regulator [Marinilactibacillus p
MIDLSKLTAGKKLTSLEKAILQYFVAHIDTVQDMGVRAVASATYTSPASVIRLSKKLGYTGFTDMYYSLLPMIKKAENNSNTENETILSTDFKSLIKNCSYENTQQFIDNVLLLKQKYIFIYATGFSQIAAEYIYKKLLVLGRKAILASGSDSVGVFENNLDDIGAMIVVSKSGETEQVYRKLKKAVDAEIYTVAFTKETDNRIGLISDLNIQILDIHQLDDRNMLPNLFFPGVLLSFESIVEQYLNQLES